MNNQMDYQVEYQQSSLIKTMQKIMQKKLDLTRIMTSNTASSDLLSTQADENLQKDLNEIKILLSEINEPSSYANATKASGRMY